jgi:regulator of RNase E activity RraA
LVIPFERAGDVLRAAQEIAAKEQIIEAKIRAGATLREARAATGYHALQTRV